MSVTRETLYNEVWAEPMIAVAARYDVSGNFLARVCQAMNVPQPSRGYWAKVKVGKAPKKPGLPAATADHATEWTKVLCHLRRCGPWLTRQVDSRLHLL